MRIIPILLLAGGAVPALHGQVVHGARFTVHVAPSAVEVRGDTVRVAYAVTNSPASTRKLFELVIDAPTPAIGVEAPPRSTEWDISTTRFYGRSVAGWIFLAPLLRAGGSAPTLAFTAPGVPGIVQYWATPWEAPDTVDAAEPPSPPATGAGGPAAFATDSGATVGVVPFPADRSRAGLLRRLAALADDACARGWVDNAGICNSLRVKIDHDQTDALLHELAAQRGKHVSDAAYFLLAGNVWALPRP